MLPSQRFYRGKPAHKAVASDRPTRVKIQTKFNSTCGECGRKIRKAEWIVLQFSDYFNDQFVWCNICADSVKGVKK